MQGANVEAGEVPVGAAGTRSRRVTDVSAGERASHPRGELRTVSSDHVTTTITTTAQAMQAF